MKFPSSLIYLVLIYIMGTFTIATLNAQGCRDSLKRFQVFEYFKQQVKADVYLVQDTQTNTMSESVWRLTWRGNIYFSHSPERAAGVAILFRPKFSFDFLEYREVVPGRALYMKCSINGKYIHILNVYAPSKDSQRTTFFTTVDNFLQTLYNKGDNWYIAGDFNCTLYPLTDRTSSYEHHPGSAKILNTTIQSLELVDIHHIFLEGKKCFTWCNKAGSASRLDRLYIPIHLYSTIVSIKSVNCHLSDHQCLKIDAQNTTANHKKSYWKLNVSVLDNPEYHTMIYNLWENWKKQKSTFTDLRLWWESAKIRIKQATQSFCSMLHSNIKKEKIRLTALLADLEQKISRKAENSVIQHHNNIKQQLNDLYKRELQVHLTTTQSQYMNESDSCTKYFFDLATVKKKKNNIHHLKTEEGVLLTDPQQIRHHIQTFYTSLYSPEEVDQKAIETLCGFVNPIPSFLAEALEEPISLDEIKKSIKDQNNNKTPGIDGIPADFYKVFAELLAEDLLEVFSFCTTNKTLPISSRRAIITLLPKSGDLGFIKNWRPVSILCSDYKIYSRLVLNRLKPYLSHIIHSDQTYAIPTRNIHHNLHLLRDAISFSNISDTPLALISIDQMKAFDRINHVFLFQLLQAYKFGPYFQTLIQIAYAEPHFLMKINNFLSQPTPFRRGLRQGCSLSAALYTLALEPFLNSIRAEPQITGISLHNAELKTTAYADDITLLVTSDSSWEHIKSKISLYEAASNAKINYEKTRGLWCGSWKGKKSSPLNITWSNTHIKLLGILLGNEDTTLLNYSNVLQKINDILNVWKPIVGSLSYRGRILIINQLCASQLWHRFCVINPPKNLLSELKKTFLNFFWQGNHWVRGDLLTLPLEEGGQGLIDLQARLFDFRLSFLRDFFSNLSDPAHGCFIMTQILLRTIHQLHYDFQLFTLSSEFSLPKSKYLDMFYCYYFKKPFKTHYSLQRDRSNLQISQILEENILYNTDVNIASLQLHPTIFINAGITKIIDLLSNNMSFLSAPLFQQKMKMGSLRIATKVLEKLIKLLPASWQQKLDGLVNNPESGINDASAPDVTVIHIDTQSLFPLAFYKKRGFYSWFVRTSIPENVSFSIKWGVGDINTSSDLIDYNFFVNTYARPNIKKHSDIQWRFLLQAFFPAHKLHSLGFSDSPLCLFCGELENYIHVFMDCPRLYSLFRILQLHIKKILKIEVPATWWIYGPPYVKTAKKPKIINWLQITAKTAIWTTRAKKMQQTSPTDAYGVYKGLLLNRLITEYHSSKIHNKTSTFKRYWQHNTFFYINHLDEVIIREH